MDHFGWSQDWDTMEEMDYVQLLLISLCIDGKNRRANLMSKGPQLVSKDAEVMMIEHNH